MARITKKVDAVEFNDAANIAQKYIVVATIDIATYGQDALVLLLSRAARTMQTLDNGSSAANRIWHVGFKYKNSADIYGGFGYTKIAFVDRANPYGWSGAMAHMQMNNWHGEGGAPVVLTDDLDVVMWCAEQGQSGGASFTDRAVWTDGNSGAGGIVVTIPFDVAA